MESTLFGFILSRSRRQQAVVVALTLVALPLYYAALEVPKLIVNRVLGAPGSRFPRPLTILGQELAELSQLGWLTVLCLAFLAAVVAHAGLKFAINVYKGRVGERLLRDLRRELCSRVMRFPPRHFERTSSDELGTIITSEVTQLGGFIGDAVALRIVAARNPFCPVEPALLLGVVQARAEIVQAIGAGPEQGLTLLDARRYHPALSVLGNLVFGAPRQVDDAGARALEGRLLALAQTLGLTDALREAALDSRIGVGGSGLGDARRQRLTRALLREPRCLLINRATSELDAGAEERIARLVRSRMRGRALLWVLDRPDTARLFQRTLVFAGTRLVEQGSYAALDRPGTRLRTLPGEG